MYFHFLGEIRLQEIESVRYLQIQFSLFTCTINDAQNARDFYFFLQPSRHDVEKLKFLANRQTGGPAGTKPVPAPRPAAGSLPRLAVPPEQASRARAARRAGDVARGRQEFQVE